MENQDVRRAEVISQLLFNELQTGSEMFSTGVHKVLDVETHHDARVELTKLIKSRIESSRMTKSRGRPKGSSNKAKTEKSLETNDQKKVKIEKQPSEFMIDLTQPKTAFKKPAELSQQSKSQDFITID